MNYLLYTIYIASGINGNTHQELNKFKKNNKILEEENNMLKLKLEIILDMLTQTTLESQKQCKEIEQLRQELKKLKD